MLITETLEFSQKWTNEPATSRKVTWQSVIKSKHANENKNSTVNFCLPHWIDGFHYLNEFSDEMNDDTKKHDFCIIYRNVSVFKKLKLTQWTIIFQMSNACG